MAWRPGARRTTRSPSARCIASGCFREPWRRSDAEQQEVEPGPQRQAGTSRSVADNSLLGKIEAYGRVIAALHEAQEAAAGVEAAAPDEWYPEALVAALRELQAALVTLEAHVTAASVHDMVARLRDGVLQAGAVADELGQIEARLHNELAPMRFVIAAPARAHLLDRDQPAFGAEVAECFPSARYDIEEAALCLALRRPTAAVFHCMKILRYGIGAFVRFLDLADPVAEGERSWRQIVQLFRSGDDKHIGESLRHIGCGARTLAQRRAAAGRQVHRRRSRADLPGAGRIHALACRGLRRTRPGSDALNHA